MLELRTKFGNFGNFGNFGHISDGLRKQYSVRTQCCNLIGSELLYIPCIAMFSCCWVYLEFHGFLPSNSKFLSILDRAYFTKNVILYLFTETGLWS